MRHNVHSQAGQSYVEVGLLLVMIALVLILVLPLVGVRLDAMLCQVVGAFGGNTSNGCALISRVLASDDFGANSGLWNFLTGSGQLCDGRLCASTSNEFRAMMSGSQAGDSTIGVDATLMKGNGYGIFFRASEGVRFNGYTFQYDPGYGGGQFIMRKWVNGTEIWPPFATASPPANYQWTNVQRHVEVTTQGNTFTAKIDGQVVLTGKDSTYASGQAGLRTWSGSQASFDNFKVTSP